jgi:hypothetical protein
LKRASWCGGDFSVRLQLLAGKIPATKQPVGQITKSLSSPSRKNILLPFFRNM